MNHRRPTEEQTLLLQACLLSGVAAENAWEHWTKRIDFDKIDPASMKLLPLVSRNITPSSNPIFERCKGVYRQIWTSNQILWKGLLPILSQLQQQGIGQIVLLKGIAMILEYYKDFGIRSMGDIDLLIPKHQLPLAHSWLMATGWRQKSPRIDIRNPDHLNRWHALNFTHASKMELDLHWSFIEENCAALDEAVLKGASLLKMYPFSVPNPTDLLLQTCIHGFKPSPIPLIRWVADAMTILKKGGEKIDWDRLDDLAHQTHVGIALSQAFQYLVESFQAPIPSSVIRQLQKTPFRRLQELECRANARGRGYLAGWYRFCIKRGYSKNRFRHIPKYLQITGRLKSPWQIPFYSVWWIGKRVFRAMRN